MAMRLDVILTDQSLAWNDHKIECADHMCNPSQFRIEFCVSWNDFNFENDFKK